MFLDINLETFLPTFRALRTFICLFLAVYGCLLTCVMCKISQFALLLIVLCSTLIMQSSAKQLPFTIDCQHVVQRTTTPVVYEQYRCNDFLKSPASHITALWETLNAPKQSQEYLTSWALVAVTWRPLPVCSLHQVTPRNYCWHGEHLEQRWGRREAPSSGGRRGARTLRCSGATVELWQWGEWDGRAAEDWGDLGRQSDIMRIHRQPGGMEHGMKVNKTWQSDFSAGVNFKMLTDHVYPEIIYFFFFFSKKNLEKLQKYNTFQSIKFFPNYTEIWKYYKCSKNILKNLKKVLKKQS